MTGYVADLSWKSGARAIEKLDRLRSTMAVNVLILRYTFIACLVFISYFQHSRWSGQNSNCCNNFIYMVRFPFLSYLVNAMKFCILIQTTLKTPSPSYSNRRLDAYFRHWHHGPLRQFICRIAVKVQEQPCLLRLPNFLRKWSNTEVEKSLQTNSIPNLWILGWIYYRVFRTQRFLFFQWPTDRNSASSSRHIYGCIIMDVPYYVESHEGSHDSCFQTDD